MHKGEHGRVISIVAFIVILYVCRIYCYFVRYEYPFRRRELHVCTVVMSGELLEPSISSTGIKLIEVGKFRIHLSSLLVEIMWKFSGDVFAFLSFPRLYSASHWINITKTY